MTYYFCYAFVKIAFNIKKERKKFFLISRGFIFANLQILKISRGFIFANQPFGNISRGFNFANLDKIREIRENLSSRKFLLLRYTLEAKYVNH